MKLQAALVLIILFFFLLAMSVPVSFCIITSAMITIIMFLTPQFGMFISAQKLVSGMCSLPEGGTLLILDCDLLLHG